MAAGRNSDIIAAARERRTDKKHIQDIQSADSNRIHRHLVPHHTYPQRPRKPRIPANTARLHAVAVERHTQTQRQHSAQRRILHIHLAGSIRSVADMLVVGIYAAVGADAHLVDNAADVHTDHNLHPPVD